MATFSLNDFEEFKHTKPKDVEEYDGYPMPDPEEVAKMSDEEKAEYKKRAEEWFDMLKEKYKQK